MTWQQAMAVLEAQYKMFREPKRLGVLQASMPRHHDLAMLKKMIIEQEQRLRDIVDQACRTFSKRRTWPQLNAEGLLLVFQRLQTALSFLRFLETTYRDDRIVADPIPKVPDWRVLEFLLVDYWERAGYEQYLFGQTRLL